MKSKSELESSETTRLSSCDNINLINAVAAGLLSSSCCLLQLILNLLSTLNVLHVGCAGFNKVLGGPVRLYMRTATLAWLITCWVQALRGGGANCCGNGGHKNQSALPRKLTRLSVLTLVLMFLPEILRATTQLRGDHTDAFFPPFAQKPLEKQSFIVDNMGCEACETIVMQTLEQCEGVKRASVNWETGLAEVWISPHIAFDFESADKRLQHHGYELHKLGHVTKKMQSEEQLNTDGSSPFEML